jgi:hypothetical protein
MMELSWGQEWSWSTAWGHFSTCQVEEISWAPSLYRERAEGLRRLHTALPIPQLMPRATCHVYLVASGLLCVQSVFAVWANLGCSRWRWCIKPCLDNYLCTQRTKGCLHLEHHFPKPRSSRFKNSVTSHDTF